MAEMTYDEILDRIEEIGTAFANDLNDGDNRVLYEGLDVTGDGELRYTATLDNGTKVEARFKFDLTYYRETPT